MTLKDILNYIDFDVEMDENHKLCLVDKQGANLGGIESERFSPDKKGIVDIINRCEIYWLDYVIRPLIEDMNLDSHYEDDWTGLYAKAVDHYKKEVGKNTILNYIINPELVELDKEFEIEYQTYVIKFKYDDMDSDIRTLHVPKDVTLGTVYSELSILNQVFFALRDIECYDSAKECIESNLFENIIDRAKQMLKLLFPEEDMVNDVYANEGANSKTLVDYLLQIHEDWKLKEDVYSLLFEFDS